MPRKAVGVDLDDRTAGKKCAICSEETLMGSVANTPPLCRERWNGRRYVRFCGPECEKKGGW